MRLFLRLCTLTALMALATGAVRPDAAWGGGTQPLRLTIAFTGDVSGYLEPCG